MVKTFKSIEEVHRKFFPNPILDYLVSEAISELYLPFIKGQARPKVNKDKENPKTGLIEFTKPNGYVNVLETISGAVKKTYNRYGVNTEQRGSGLIVATKDDEIYWISLFEYPSSFNV